METWILDFKAFFKDTMTKATIETTDRITACMKRTFESVSESVATLGDIADAHAKQEAEQQDPSDVWGGGLTCQEQQVVPEGFDRSIIPTEHKVEQMKMDLDFKPSLSEDPLVENPQCEGEATQQMSLQFLWEEPARMDKDIRLDKLTEIGTEIQIAQMVVSTKPKDSILYEMSEDGGLKEAQLNRKRILQEDRRRGEMTLTTLYEMSLDENLKVAQTMGKKKALETHQKQETLQRLKLHEPQALPWWSNG